MTKDDDGQSRYWSGRRVLVTGAGGFIGSHLVERLVGLGARVRGLVHYNAMGNRGWLDRSTVIGEVEVAVGDVRDADSVRAAVEGCECVFHLAALIAIPYSYQAPQSFVDTNVSGTLNVMQAARRLKVDRVVQMSSSEVYGSAQCSPMDESHRIHVQSPYAASKAGADLLAQSFGRSYGVPVVTARPFNTYGPRQSVRAVVPTIVAQALSSPEIKLGSLDTARDLTYVEDTVDGLIAVAACSEAIGETVNIGNGRTIVIGDLVKKVLAIIGVDLPVRCDARRLRPAESEVQELCASAEKLRRLTDWRPRFSLSKGLRETVGWMRENASLLGSHGWRL